jgi:predicted HicB family RNase H-like nuclease
LISGVSNNLKSGGLNMGYLNYKGYKGSIEYSEADNCLFGLALGMTKSRILYEGNTIDELKADFEAGIDSYLDTCNTNGIKPEKNRNACRTFGDFRRKQQSKIVNLQSKIFRRKQQSKIVNLKS